MSIPPSRSRPAAAIAPHPFNGREIRGDELNPIWKIGRCSGGRKNCCTFNVQSVPDRLSVVQQLGVLG